MFFFYNKTTREEERVEDVLISANVRDTSLMKLQLSYVTACFFCLA